MSCLPPSRALPKYAKPKAESTGQFTGQHLVQRQQKTLDTKRGGSSPRRNIVCSRYIYPPLLQESSEALVKACQEKSLCIVQLLYTGRNMKSNLSSFDEDRGFYYIIIQIVESVYPALPL
eukprot:scaffold8973_cov75-Skeletonema_dohrnii-CCMP3373.AAC.4